MFKFRVILVVEFREILVIIALEFRVIFAETNVQFERKNNKNYSEFDR